MTVSFGLLGHDVAVSLESLSLVNFHADFSHLLVFIFGFWFTRKPGFDDDDDERRKKKERAKILDLSRPLISLFLSS